MPHHIPSLRRETFVCLISVFFFTYGHAQDSISRMDEIIIRAYDQNRKLQEVPAAVNFINRRLMERFNSVSMVQAVNATPGVRMEERSPGSYRFSIRGSTLRSPFGVRNLKVYYNDLPMTDPGGQTYLNQLGYYNFSTLEIIKGPGSSLYGAGTGGVLMIESLNGKEEAGVTAEYSAGSYGLKNMYAAVTTGTSNYLSRASFQHQESNGFRDHSKLNRNVHSWTGQFHFGNSKLLKASFLYGDLFYETPGGLTAEEWKQDPKAARPATGTVPGAVEAGASVHQKTFLAGLSYEQQLAPHWQNKSMLYGMFTELKNPTLRNYGRNAEPHVGGRTVFRYTTLLPVSISWDLGAEWQEGFSILASYTNRNGQPDSLLSMDDVNNRNQFLFSQATLDWKNWIFTAGASVNMLKLKFRRFDPINSGRQQRNFHNQVAPRIALLRRMGKFSIYSSVSSGFSPPSTSELLPTGGPVNLDLKPETGTNYDVGLKLFSGVFYLDVNAFIFSLDGTIVQRRDSAGGGFFINAGKTKQAGIETALNIQLFSHRQSLDHSIFWFSHTWHRFLYRSFTQLNTDYSGNRMPGEPADALSSGIDIRSNKGWLAGVNYSYNSRIYLDDANSVWSTPVHLLGGRIGWQKLWDKKWRLKFIFGADNLLDQDYSLGNDLNAAGGRYFNAAPGRNYYFSLMAEWVSRKLLR